MLPSAFALRSNQSDLAQSAAGLSCTHCITSDVLATGAVGSEQIQAGAVGDTQLSVLYAVSATKGGQPNNLECGGCVDSTEVSFPWAASTEAGGPAAVALSLDCPGCVGITQIGSQAVGSAQIKDGAVLAKHVGFLYAHGDANGAANDVSCPHCVDGGDLATNLSIAGNIDATGSITACSGNAAGCTLGVGNDIDLVRQPDQTLLVLTPNGLRLRNADDSAWTELRAGKGTFYAGLEVQGTSTMTGPVTVAGDFDLSSHQIKGMRFENAASAPVTCGSSTIGYAYYDTTEHKLFVCDGSAFANVCDSCGAPPAGDCCASHSTPGCDDATVQACVCDMDPFCCGTAWDSICVGEANSPCGACGGTTTEDCCTVHSTIGCEDANVQSCVCGMDSFCCTYSWDSICAGEAANDCGADCGGGSIPGGTCCSTSSSPGCSVSSIETCVCDLDSFCCEEEWDYICVDEAQNDCGADCGGAM